MSGLRFHMTNIRMHRFIAVAVSCLRLDLIGFIAVGCVLPTAITACRIYLSVSHIGRLYKSTRCSNGEFRLCCLFLPHCSVFTVSVSASLCVRESLMGASGLLHVKSIYS